MVNKTDGVSVPMESTGWWMIEGKLQKMVVPAQGTSNLPLKCQMSQDLLEG